MAESIDIKFLNTWNGYQNFSDITNADISQLQPGSQNVFIIDGDRLEPRAGITYFGAPGTDGNTVNPYWCPAHRIHSKYDEFITVQGLKVPLRVYYSGQSAIGDTIEAWLPVNGDPTSTVKAWVPITSTVGGAAFPILSAHRYFFDQWWDRINLLSRTIFTVGNNNIWTWSGGFAPVTGVTATTITTNAIWTSKGFIDSPEGNPRIIVNGNEYNVTSGFGTNTITVASTTGISIGDLVLHGVQGNDTLGGGTTYDVCATLNNQVYYIDWKQRNCYVSWNRNQDSLLNATRTIFQGAGLDDGYYTGTYTGNVIGTYKVVISSVNPSTDSQVFVPGGDQGVDDVVYNTSGYGGAAGATNTYKFVIVSDFRLLLLGVGTCTVGETVVGATSGATGVVVLAFNPGPQQLIELRNVNGAFLNTETVTGQNSGVSGSLLGSIFINRFSFYKNNTQIIQNQVLATSNATTDGIIVTSGEVYGHSVGDAWILTINEGGIDTFQWQLNGSPLSSPIAITGGPQSLTDGVSFQFTNEQGHTVGDSWTVIANQAIRRGWTNFTYDSPNRLPGQGFNMLLDSNGWTLKPQENKMYINGQAGHYYQVQTKLSSDLLNENVEIERLKSEPQNKVLFPYLIGYDKNQLAGISQDKSYDSLGRQELIELPQTKSISDQVRIDFETANWENGDFLYGFRKLFFSVPETGKMFIWDDYKKYWHTPMKFAQRVGLVSIIDGVLCGHSYERNETYQLFTGQNDLGIFPIETKMVFAYDSFGKRYFQKSCRAIGFEGYIDGAPQINYVVNADVAGCNGQATGTILPVLCSPADKASLGKSHLGFHGLGNDPVEVIPHFFFIDTFDKMNFYQRNIELSCESDDQRWSIVSIGTDISLSEENNTTIVHRKVV